ncbi:Lanosterol 14-alpha demethylase [Grifola frondosa]|uniref:Lanosterol 14-alpha demethylase n=1 Tax=Grifola frondosa TaxID=5627 RepID=A0A1C7LVG5_GRIFR|nr:Lanosterol 14-alpha demethylase [Grifola frondosa]
MMFYFVQQPDFKNFLIMPSKTVSSCSTSSAYASLRLIVDHPNPRNGRSLSCTLCKKRAFPTSHPLSIHRWNTRIYSLVRLPLSFMLYSSNGPNFRRNGYHQLWIYRLKTYFQTHERRRVCVTDIWPCHWCTAERKPGVYREPEIRTLCLNVRPTVQFRTRISCYYESAAHYGVDGGSLFRDLQDFVREGIIARIDEIAYRIFPLFERDAKSFVDLAGEGIKTGYHPSCYNHFRGTIAETTLVLLLGEHFYQNFSILGKYFPFFWIIYTWVKVMLISIPFGFLRIYGPQLWQDVNKYEAMAASGKVSPKDEPRSVLYLIVKTYTPPDGRSVGVFRRMYIAILLLCLIFASVHTTTVVSQWVLFQLAVRPEYLEPLREELSRVLEQDESGALRLTAASLREARLLDSFIREVMRLKGDTISTMRYTTCDVALGDYIIPKGHFVTPMSTTVHENPDVFGAQSREFNGFQWAEQNKEAVMTGPAHIVFGLGRFACPGRVLAVNEIKLIVFSLIARATPSLLEGFFEVSDPLNTVTQPPKGTLVMTPLETPLL